MKKRLALALAASFVFGVAGTAFAAANPFVDVPAKHWAYDSVAKLVKAGIVDGYGDGTFRGDKTLTRYEMAQIVAKAMAKSDKADAETKAIVDKLAVEFASELNNLGVRVAKLEKNQSNIKFSGDARIRQTHQAEYANNVSYGNHWQERLRLNMNAQVNDNTSFYGRIMAMNHNDMGTRTTDSLNIVDANFTTKNPFNLPVDVTVGRFSQNFGQTTYWMGSTGMIDGAKINFGNAVKVQAGFANFDATTKMGDAYFVEAAYPVSKAVTVSANYIKETHEGSSFDSDKTVDDNAAAALLDENNPNFSVYGVGVKAKLNKNFTFLGDYGQNTEIKGDPSFYVARLAYKGADKNVPQSWGAHVEYLKFENGSYAGETGAMISNLEGFKSWSAQYSVALAKNIVLDAIYQWDIKEVDTNKDRGDYTRFQINYNF